jgi:nucleoside-diphosphate-sugar epimerase
VKPPRGDVYNVGSGRAVAVSQYLAAADRLCRERFGRPLRITVREEGGSARAAMDTARLRAAGWMPALPLERSIADLFEFFARAP